MKSFYFLLTGIIFFPVFRTPAQQPADTIKLWTKYPGYIITNEDDTIRGSLLLKNKISNQGKVFFFENENSEEPSAKYKPRDIKAYKVANRFYETKKYSPEYTTMRYCFLLKTLDGPISLYEAYYDDKKRIQVNEDEIWKSKIDLSFSEAELTGQTLGCRQGEELELFDGTKYLLNFKKSMSVYLSDCPGIAKKIANKEEGYKWTDIEKIIREYNEWYLKNH